MKKIMFALLASALAFAACEPKEDSPTVSFTSALPINSDGSAVLTISVTDYAGTAPVTVPVKFSGSAIKDIDYKLSAEEFVYGGSNPVTSITLTPIKYDDSKTVTASLEIPSGFIAGQYSSSTFNLSGKIAYASFESKQALMTSSATVTVCLFDGNGAPKKPASGDRIPVRVNTEKSTAIEGTHFSFAEEKVFIINPDKSTGTLILNFIGEKPEAGKDLIVLNLDLEQDGKYGVGQYNEIEINILGSMFNNLDGKWVANELITDAETMENDFWVSQDDLVGFPEFNENDAITIDIENSIFTPEFQSDFKNYFIGKSNITKGDEIEIMLDLLLPPTRTKVMLLELDNINRYFSPTEQSEDKKGYIGIRIFTDEESSQELLDLFVLDHTSKAFFHSFIEGGFYNETKPVATGTGIYLRMTFKKVE